MGVIHQSCILLVKGDGLHLKTTRKTRGIKYPWLRAGEVILYYLIEVLETGKEI
jgi:hypothetical protein